VAAALTYTTLLALVPLLTITVLVFHNFPAFEEIGASLHDFLSANLLPEAASRLVTLYTREFIANSTQLSVIGILMLIVTALLLLATIESALNRIWRIRRPRSPGARLVTYWFVLTAGPLLLGFGVYLTTRLARESLQLAGMGALRHPLHLLFADLDFLMDPLPARPPSSRASTPRHARRLRHHAGLPARTARICPFSCRASPPTISSMERLPLYRSFSSGSICSGRSSCWGRPSAPRSQAFPRPACLRLPLMRRHPMRTGPKSIIGEGIGFILKHLDAARSAPRSG